MRHNSVAFANFICRFGDEKVLLDYAYEIVVPAFTRDTYVRSYGTTTHYHFYEVKVVTLDNSTDPAVTALAGRFIKNTELTRYQIFDEQQGLIQDEQRMRSAPSVYFVLILNNHRLIYFPETPNAPDMSAFRATAMQFLRLRHKEFIDQLYDERDRGDRSASKKALKNIHPRPTLDIIPLTGAENIEQFLRRFEILKRIDFNLIRPNDDIDAGEIFEQIREFSNNLNADRTRVTTANPDEGLDIDASIDAVTEATEHGNQEATLNGVDHEGNKLTGNNEHFQIQASLAAVPSTDSGLVLTLYETFKALVASSAIKIPALVGSQAEKVRQLIRRL